MNSILSTSEKKRLKVLLIVEQCNPDWSSVPLLAYNLYNEIKNLCDVTLVTHQRNKKALEKTESSRDIVFISENGFLNKYYRCISKLLTSKGNLNWPLLHVLTYPIYSNFNRKVYKKLHKQVLNGEYDIVHVFTPIIPRYSSKIINACEKTPFLLGPVNGGVPFPEGFNKVAKSAHVKFDFLKYFSRLMPGYLKTYRKASCVLAGSTYTMDKIQNMTNANRGKLKLFYENGISNEFLKNNKNPSQEKQEIKLLFVGRLVSLKGIDMLIEAIAQIENNLQNRIRLTIVGDGPEKERLEAQVRKLNLNESVIFTGWIEQKQTADYYNSSDIFCFPSLREFGGGVIFEAMAHSLPCIVVDNGGPGEYVTEDTGYKIKPLSREYVIKELARLIKELIINSGQRQQMSASAFERAKEFEWSQKARQIVEIYKRLIHESC